MSASDGWLIPVAGYAVLLARPLSTVVPVRFAVRYVGAHRATVVNRALAGGDGRAERFRIIMPALSEEAVAVNTVLTILLSLTGTLGLVSGHPLPVLRTWSALRASLGIRLIVTTFPGRVWVLAHRAGRLAEEPLLLRTA
ncbi:hypothetical protein [Actinoplanes teichomyceticus]|uniref:Uncharacterized protein n=1 Tax=Actinoplanes teichomyceticus TaxID=1867 RepID=A0A561WQS6_ACTTI|nr:hypothetical protein [Actinoplanes teichomyceticus]TWG26220.1 hypothetical protein FHX34_1011201 [Actinoplanes teichomyceticus]GIF11299.1 hypothetical protein Ate01nite_13310 [Actinoplanes teichomyceticus]